MCGCFFASYRFFAGFCTSFLVMKLAEETGKYYPETAGQAFEVAAEGHDLGWQERLLIARSSQLFVLFFGVLFLIWVAANSEE